MSLINSVRFLTTPSVLLLGLSLGIIGAQPQGCITEPMNATPTPPPPPVAQVYHQPVFAALPDTTETLTKGGVEITVVPLSYKPDIFATTASNPGNIYTSSHFGGGEQPYTQEMRTVETTETAGVRVKPNVLGFAITVSNKMPHTFNGQGASVRFVVDGHKQDMNELADVELKGLVLSPRESKKLTILGPALSTISAGEGANVGLWLSDIVTETDDAGVVKKKEEFAWNYKFAIKDVTTDVPAPKVTQSEEPVGPKVYKQKEVKAAPAPVYRPAPAPAAPKPVKKH